MELKDKIKLLRREAGLTQKETAEKIGVTYRTYQNYEGGASVPSGVTLARLANAFGVSVDMLIPSVAVAKRESDNEELCALLSEMQALFSGGKLCEEDKQYVIDALTEAFFKSKELKGVRSKNIDG